mgnify:CR=1 FL=1
MNGQRRVVRTSRGVYGRSVPLAAPARRRVRLDLGWTMSQRLRRLAVITLVGVGLLGASTWFLAIKHVNVAASEQQEAITKDIWRQLQAGWWPPTLVAVDIPTLESAVKKAHPIVKTVAIQRRWPNTLDVTVELKSPKLAWFSGSQLMVLDADGSAIGGLSAADTKLPVVYDGSNLPVEAGQTVVRPQFVSFVQELIAGLNTRGIGITKLKVGQTTLDLTVETAKTYQLIFDTARPAEEGLRDLDAVLKTAIAQKKPVNEYIDLRISGKAYYK